MSLVVDDGIIGAENWVQGNKHKFDKQCIMLCDAASLVTGSRRFDMVTNPRK
jgi:hypothetical protein